MVANGKVNCVMSPEDVTNQSDRPRNACLANLVLLNDTDVISPRDPWLATKVLTRIVIKSE